MIRTPGIPLGFPPGGLSRAPRGDAGPPAPALVSITVTGDDEITAYEGTVQLTATGTYDDESTADVTALVSWASSDTDVATVAAGLVTRQFTGRVTVTATLGELSDDLEVTCPPRVPQSAAEMATATGGYGEWLIGWGFDEPSGSVSAPSWNATELDADIELLEGHVLGTPGLASVAGDLALGVPDYSEVPGASTAPPGLVATPSTDDGALLIVGTGHAGAGASGYVFAVDVGPINDAPTLTAHFGGWGDGEPVPEYAVTLPIAMPGYVAGDPVVAMVVVERDAGGAGEDLATAALATAQGAAAYAEAGDVSGDTVGDDSWEITGWGGARTLTLVARAGGPDGCAGMVANAAAVVDSVARYVGIRGWTP